jgi:flagellar biosynthesis/type III secretory pathway chaperone
MVASRQEMGTAGLQEYAALASRAMKQESTFNLDRCITTSERLLCILRAEAEALKAFQKERLLELVAEKEALAIELAHRMKAGESSKLFAGKTGHEAHPHQAPKKTGGEETSEERAKRDLLRGLLEEIARWNQKNHLFVQGSLGHWQDILNLCLPSTYISRQNGQAARQAIRTKGLALNREA